MKYQLVKYFPEWRGLNFFKPTLKNRSDLYLIFEWFFDFAFWEIRKFLTQKQMAERLELYKKSK